MTQVFVCCEGSRDAGALKALIEKCIPVSVECRTHKEVKVIKIRSLKSSKKGKDKDDEIGRKAHMRRIAHLANEHNSDFIAYHQDADNKYKDVYQDVCDDFSEQREKGFHCLAIVPKEMTEAWLLADEQAYLLAYGSKSEHLPKKPEDILGKKDAPNHPKKVMERVLGQYHKTPNRATYAEIAERCSIDTLNTKCRVSFGQFYKDLQRFVKEQPHC